ncbi:MAG: restriction endonuclease subunit S [Metallibacterium sp.]
MTLTIPVGPEARRLRFLFETRSGATPSSGVEEYWDGDITWVTPEDLGKLSDRYVRETRRRITEEGYKNCGVSLAAPGSIVLSKRAPIGQTAILGVPSTCNQGCFLLTKVDGVDERFYYYALIHLRPALEALGRGSTFMELSADDLRSVLMPFPREEDQRLIANYLDRETAHIDGLIAEKERMLALLEEKRAALISRVVTRGLDPNAPLKPSGQEWLGEIPAHWQEPRAKGLFREVERRTETGEETLLSLRMGKGLVPHNEVSEKLLEASDVTGFKKIEPGQMVVNRMRAASGLIAVATESGLVSPDYAVFDVVDQDLSIEYFLELFKTSLLQAVFRSSSKGLGTGEQGFLRLYTDAFLSLHFPYPPVAEQRAVASFIEQQRSEMLQMENLLGRSIDLAKERRAALISAAVTGQIPLEEMTG